MTTFKQRLRTELQESINYVLMELDTPPTQSYEKDAPAVDTVNPDMRHLFNLNDVNVTQIVADNPDITFGEVAELTGTTSWESAGHTETKTQWTIGLPFLRALGRTGQILFGGDGWFQEEFIWREGISKSQEAFERTNGAIDGALASGIQGEFFDEETGLQWGEP